LKETWILTFHKKIRERL